MAYIGKICSFIEMQFITYVLLVLAFRLFLTIASVNVIAFIRNINLCGTEGNVLMFLLALIVSITKFCMDGTIKKED